MTPTRVCVCGANYDTSCAQSLSPNGAGVGAAVGGSVGAAVRGIVGAAVRGGAGTVGRSVTRRVGGGDGGRQPANGPPSGGDASAKLR